jgi:hypothetical protein
MWMFDVEDVENVEVGVAMRATRWTGKRDTLVRALVARALSLNTAYCDAENQIPIAISPATQGLSDGFQHLYSLICMCISLIVSIQRLFEKADGIC